MQAPGEYTDILSEAERAYLALNPKEIAMMPFDTRHKAIVFAVEQEFDTLRAEMAKLAADLKARIARLENPGYGQAHDQNR